MKFAKVLAAGTAAAMLAAAPVAAQQQENAFGDNDGAIAALFGLLVVGLFIAVHGDDEPVSP